VLKKKGDTYPNREVLITDRVFVGTNVLVCSRDASLE
jgi:hypothetical protein